MEANEGIDKELYQAAVEGNKSVFTEYDEGIKQKNYFLKTTPHKNNIIHLAVRHNKDELEFMEEAVKRFPEIISECNCDGDNPLHLAAMTGNRDIVKLLFDSNVKILENQTQLKPWKAQNKEGNTPLHVALIYGKIDVACYFAEADPEVARICNKLDETPLHLAIRYHVDENREAVRAAMKLVVNKLDTGLPKAMSCRQENSMSVIELLLQKEPSMASLRNAQGLTPILIASTLNPPYRPAIEFMIKHSPESLELCDHFGRNLLHLMNVLPDDEEYEMLESCPAIKALINNQDNEGNTPTHVAVMKHNIKMLHILLEFGADITIRNKQSVFVANLIQQQSDDFWDLCKEQAMRFNYDDDNDESRKLSQEDKDAIDTLNMSYLRERLNKDGSSFFLKENLGDNILHLIDWSNYESFNNDQLSFIQQALETSPCLMWQINIFGETPLHCIAKNAPTMIDKLFMEKVKNNFNKANKVAPSVREICFDPPWKTKDDAGNTPVHEALASARPGNLRCARAMLMIDTTLIDEVNNAGETPLHLLANSSIFDRQLNPEEIEDVKGILNLSYRAWRKEDMEGLNPLTRAAKYKNLQFIKLTLKMHYRYRFAQLHMRDHNGNTLWHYLASIDLLDNINQDQENQKFLEDMFDCIGESLHHANKEGNTPLHLAVENVKFHLVQIFLKLLLKTKNTLDLAKRNNNGETVFHLCAGVSETKLTTEFVRNALEKQAANVMIRDNEGNTPLHSAIDNVNFDLAHIFLTHLLKTKKPHDLAKCNNNGKTVFHLCVGVSEEISAKEFVVKALKNQPSDVLMIRDNEGNTPLHMAILKEDFNLANIFVKSFRGKDDDLENILTVKNSRDDTPRDLMANARNIPTKFEAFIWRDPELKKAMSGLRSYSGVFPENIKDYTNTIGVTAALFTTITFTTAFTVPGGVNQNDGTPLLLKKIAFQLFLVADIIAMCLSMMVLFCLLWIMTIDYKKHQLALVDLTIFLLEASFYTTIFTFMMGLFVTVYPITHWIPIVACVLCSLLILFMHKRLIPYFIDIYMWFRNMKCSCFTNHQNQEIGGQQSIHTHGREGGIGRTNSIQVNQDAGQAQSIVDMPTGDAN